MKKRIDGRDKMLAARITTAQHAALSQLAANSHRTVSDQTRYLIDAAIKYEAMFNPSKGITVISA